MELNCLNVNEMVDHKSLTYKDTHLINVDLDIKTCVESKHHLTCTGEMRKLKVGTNISNSFHFWYNYEFCTNLISLALFKIFLLVIHPQYRPKEWFNSKT